MSAGDREGCGLEPGTSLDDSLIIEDFIAASGFGCVFRGRELVTRETVAVKCLKTECQAKAYRRRQFANEADVWEALDDHPAIVRFIRRIVDGKALYLVLEYCDRGTLHDLINDVYPSGLPPALAASTFVSLCAALEHVHRAGFAFRDLNLGNVLYCSADGTLEAKLTDFGLACRAGDPGERLGLPDVNAPGQEHFTAPEQWCGSTAPCEDVYALGAVGWTILTGAVPFEAPQEMLCPESEGEWYAYRRALMKMHRRQHPRDPRELRPDVPEGAAEAILACLEKKPKKRPADLGRLATDFAGDCRDWAR
ncbi:MAG: serine/threonine-protein kinase [Planctomycetota bacterium]